MKTIYSILLTALILFVLSLSLKAQQEEICEGETASFRLNGYKNGEIVWQKSTDQNNWEDISDTNDEIFEVTVTDSLYYRAKVTEGDCKPYYSDTTEIIMLPQPITADAGDNITDACVPVTLNANTSSNGTGEWTVVSGSGGSFDDPTSPTAEFSGNPGETYTLEWAIGTQCDTTKDQVDVSFIEVDFSADKTTIIPGETVNFTDESTGNPTSWSWDFGDGESSSQENPSHTYSSAGTYTVELTVSNDCGSNTVTKTDYITVCPSSFTDSRDGETYNVEKIGGQCWMAENLNYELADDDVGNNWCYDNDQSNCDTYGRLYDWNAVMQGESSSNSNPSGVQGVCPDGWHLPSDEEWKELEMQLGMSQSEADNDDWRGTNEGSKLAGNASLWNSSDLTSDSEFGTSGFTALPGGLCSGGDFWFIEYNGYWWSSTEFSSTDAWYRGLSSNYTNVDRNNDDKEYGFSVRCVKD